MSNPTTKTKETTQRGELSEEQLSDVSGGPIYMSPSNVTLLPAVQTNPIMPTSELIGLRH